MPKVLDATLCMSGTGNHIPTQPDNTKRSGIRYTEQRPRTAETRNGRRSPRPPIGTSVGRSLIELITYYRTIGLSISNFAVCRKICCGHWRGDVFCSAPHATGFAYGALRAFSTFAEIRIVPEGLYPSMRDDHRLKRMTK